MHLAFQGTVSEMQNKASMK